MDKLVARVAGYNETLKRICISCDTTFDQLDNPYHECNPVTWEAMNNVALHGTDAERTAVAQYRCVNAFTNIEVGDPETKIYGACGMDLMHSLREGIEKRTTTLVIDCLGTSGMSKLDDLARWFHYTHRQSARKQFPKTEFSNGIQVSYKTSAEQCGLIFALVCLAQFKDGWKILD